MQAYNIIDLRYSHTYNYKEYESYKHVRNLLIYLHVLMLLFNYCLISYVISKSYLNSFLNFLKINLVEACLAED